MSGPVFWLTVSGWLAFGAHVLWGHRARVHDWLEDLLDPPRPAHRPTTVQRSHVRLVERDG